MVKGLYSAYTGMIHQQHRMDVLTNNLANADTTGFKKEGASLSIPFLRTRLRTLPMGFTLPEELE